MFISLCFLLTLASYGFSGVQSYVALAFPGRANMFDAVNSDLGYNAKYMGDLNNYAGNINSIASMGSDMQAKKQNMTFFVGTIFGILGPMPLTTTSDLQPPATYNWNEDEGLRADTSENMKKFDEKLGEALNALDSLESKVKSRSGQSKRFMQYN